MSIILSLLIFFIGLELIVVKSLGVLHFFILVYLTVLSYFDLKKREVENSVFIVFYVLGGFLAYFFKKPLIDTDFYFAVVILVASIILFYAVESAVGGADVKALFIIAYFIGIDSFTTTLLLSTIFGVIAEKILSVLDEYKYKVDKNVPFLFCLQLAYVGGLIFEKVS